VIERGPASEHEMVLAFLRAEIDALVPITSQLADS
jgi:hypothetical protein